MQKLELYAELLLRWVVLLISLPFCVAAFLCYTLGLAAEHFGVWILGYLESTRKLLASQDQTNSNEFKTPA